MKISIITVVYNNVATLETAILSVLSQTYQDIEYIIIDGGSTDGTLDVIDKYKQKISCVISETDKGIYDAMNKGVSKATGEIIGILNSDDLYEDQDVINDVFLAFLESPNIDVVYGDLLYVKYSDTNKLVRNWISKSYYPRYFDDGNVPPHPSLFVKKAVYQKISLFNLSYKLAADYELMLRIFKVHEFKSKYLNRYMVRMRLGGATNKSIKNIFKGNKEILKAWKDNGLEIPYFFVLRRIIKRVKQFLI
jgi:glycosyltransferase